MKISFFPRLLAALLGVFLALLVPATATAAEQLYTCGMHPQVIKQEPGNCPICGMKLTPVRNNGGLGKASHLAGERKIKFYKSTMTPGEVKPGPGKDAMGMDLVPVYEDEDSSSDSKIQIDAATTQRMNLKTALVEKGPVHREFRTTGTVAFNEESLRDITLKYEGWIEKLSVNTTWAVVKTGDPLFEIYSPDLYNAQLNYLVALRTEPNGEGPMVRASLERMKLFDVPQSFVDKLKQSGEAQRTFLFRAPSDGVVIEKMGIAGQMIKPGERIFRLADLSTVWVEAQVYEKDLPYVREGQAVVLHTSYGPERTFEGKVQLLLPQVQEQTRTITARIILPNTDRFLRPGMFVSVDFSALLAEDAVLVPDVAVLRSGERNTVFIALEDGFFEPREVKLGVRSSANFYEVLDGLRAGDRVVTSGQFMLDSESQLRDAIQKMLKSTPTKNEPAEPPAPPKTEKPHPEAKPAPAAKSAEPEALTPLALAVADASAALGADNFADYKKQVPPLRASLVRYAAVSTYARYGPLAPYIESFPDPATLQEARSDFARFSSAVADIVRSQRLERKLGLHVFECPMAPGGTARWIQRSEKILNPYFGADMPACGNEIAPLTATTSSQKSEGVR